MEEKANLSMRWKNFEPTKKLVFWACVGSVVLTIVVGFKWGGWVTGGTAQEMAENAATDARVKIAAASCVVRFGQGVDAKGRLTILRKTESWDRGGYMEKAGWATPMGTEEPIVGAGARCAEQLLSAKTTN